MDKIFARQCYFIFLLVTIFATGCNKSESSGYNPNTTTLTDLLASSANATIFNSAVLKANLDTVFNSPSLFTLFVPTDLACTQSGYTQAVINGFTEEQAKEWVLYQTYAGAALSSESFIGKTGEKLIMANGDSVFVTGDSNRTFVNGFELINSEAVASNGVMLALQNVLVTPTENLFQKVSADTSLSFLTAAIQLATPFPDSLEITLSTGGPFSFMAPNNDAFRKLGFNLPSDLDTVNTDSLRSIVQTAMIPQRLFSCDITDSSSFKTVNDSTLDFYITGIIATVQLSGSANPSNVFSVNDMAINGVLYKIDEVLGH